MRFNARVLQVRSSIRPSARLIRTQTPARTALYSTTLDSSTSRSTINQDEISHFSKLSALWWDEQGEFQMLHRMNPTRIKFVREKLVSRRRDFESCERYAHVILP